MSDEFGFGVVGMGVLITAHDHLASPTDDVRVRHDPLALNHESCPPGAMHRFEPPGRIPDRLLNERHDLDDRPFRLCRIGETNGAKNAEKPDGSTAAEGASRAGHSQPLPVSFFNVA